MRRVRSPTVREGNLRVDDAGDAPESRGKKTENPMKKQKVNQSIVVTSSNCFPRRVLPDLLLHKCP